MPKSPRIKTIHLWIASSIMQGLAITFLSLSVILSGCSLLLDGSGEVGIGLRDSMFVIYHDVDPDKADTTAKSTLEVNDSVLEALLGAVTLDEPPDEVSPPSTLDPG